MTAGDEVERLVTERQRGGGALSEGGDAVRAALVVSGEAQELGAALSTATAYLRALEAAGERDYLILEADREIVELDEATTEKLLDRAEELVRVICAETGKQAAEAVTTELMAVCETIDWYARNSERILRAQPVGSGTMAHKSAWKRYEPLGVIGVILAVAVALQLGQQLTQRGRDEPQHQPPGAAHQAARRTRPR